MVLHFFGVRLTQKGLTGLRNVPLRWIGIQKGPFGLVEVLNISLGLEWLKTVKYENHFSPKSGVFSLQNI